MEPHLLLIKREELGKIWGKIRWGLQRPHSWGRKRWPHWFFFLTSLTELVYSLRNIDSRASVCPLGCTVLTAEDYWTMFSTSTPRLGCLRNQLQLSALISFISRVVASSGDSSCTKFNKGHHQKHQSNSLHRESGPLTHNCYKHLAPEFCTFWYPTLICDSILVPRGADTLFENHKILNLRMTCRVCQESQE